MTPCPLPLVALRGDETCPRCGRPAREHRGHPAYVAPTVNVGVDFATEPDQTVRQYFFPSDNCPVNDATDPRCICWRDEGTGPLKDYPGRVTWRTVRKPQPQETTMSETNEPTREQIESIRADYQPGDVVYGLCAMALRTLDAEAQLDHARRRIYWFDARDNAADETIAVLTKENIALIDRAEGAEAQLAAMTAQSESYKTMALSAARRVRDIHAIVCGEDDSLSPREQHEAIVMDAKHHGPLDAERAARLRYAVGLLTERANEAEERARLAKHDLEDVQRQNAALRERIAEPSPPTTDARLDCESSSLLLLSTWARKVMMRPKNRAKGVPSESVEELIVKARKELTEAREAIEEDAHTDDILAELGDAAAYIAFAMREVESRRAR